MTLLIDNTIAEQALKMPEAIEAMESAWKQYAEGNATFQPRTDLWAPTATMGDYFRWAANCHWNGSSRIFATKRFDT